MKAINIRLAGIIACCLLLCCGCHPRSCVLDPDIEYAPQKKQFELNPSAFPPISQEEMKTEWGRELAIGISFGRELDLYRAITAFKRALILMPNSEMERRLQTQYYVVQSYYLGGKYRDVIETFEQSELTQVTPSFPAFRELLTYLYDSYWQEDQNEKADEVMRLLNRVDSDEVLDLNLYTAISTGDIADVEAYALDSPEGDDVRGFISSYCCCAKSVKTAQTLNALFPGAGYLYVGQKKTAVTSFFINLFTTAATYYFFDKGNWGAGCFALSLEIGWYIGGINGAGLAAKQYNQKLYQDMGKDMMIRQKLFPVLMIETSF